MKTFKKTIFFLVGVLGFINIQSQSLLKDANDLLYALEILNDKDSIPDSLAIFEASADVMAILYSYDQTIINDSLTATSLHDLIPNYTNNPLVSTLISDSIIDLSLLQESNFISLTREKLNIRNSGPRQKMLELLHADKAIAPADYLSVSNALNRYRIPPIPPEKSMAIIAENSNSNISNGLLTSEAAVIQGMFKFIIDRAKDEVIINFLERLVHEDSPKFGKLFPTVVGQFGLQEFTYSNSFIERLRQAFYEDIQKMTINLPLLMLEDEYFKPLQANPIAYSLITLYSMIGMGQNGMPIDEILPITHRYLYETYGETRKKVNFEVADKAYSSPEYEKLIELTKTVKNQIKAIYLDIDNIQDAIRDTISLYENKFKTKAGPLAQHYFSNHYNDLEIILGDSSRFEFGLHLLPYLLEGRLDSAYMLGYNTIAAYDHFFGKERSTHQWRAAGLELCRNLNGTWYNDHSLADILKMWQKNVAQYNIDTDRWKQGLDPAGALLRAIDRMESKRKTLQSTTLAQKDFWMSRLNYDQRLAFNALANIIDNFDMIDNDVDLMMQEAMGENVTLIKLAKKRYKLNAVEDRLIKLNNNLLEKYPDEFRTSPLDIYLLSDEASTPYAFILSKINDLEKTIQALQKQLTLVENKFARLDALTRNNAQPVLQSMDIITQMMFAMRSDRWNRKWITMGELDYMLDGSIREKAFIGLLFQRFSNIKDIGFFSPDGIAQLMTLTVKDMQYLPAFNEDDLDKVIIVAADTIIGGIKIPKKGSGAPLEEKLIYKDYGSSNKTPVKPKTRIDIPDSLAFYYKSAFAVNTFNRLLELPLVVDRNNPGRYVPLKDQWKQMSRAPEVTSQALDFIYYVNIKDHSKAISSLIRLFTNLDDIIVEQKTLDGKISKRKPAINYLIKYGDFIADLVDAETSDQVKDLLDNIADPPGSSRIKRRKRLTVGINSYLGMTVGRERFEWQTFDTNLQTLKDTSITVNSFSPTMPIGVAMSFTVGKVKKQSFSIFIAFLDLGGLLTYRTGANLVGSSSLNFKNILKPSLQFQYNIKKSPFYLTVGTHFGPNYRTVGGESISFNTRGVFAGFGIDVPIKTLYQN